MVSFSIYRRDLNHQRASNQNLRVNESGPPDIATTFWTKLADPVLQEYLQEKIGFDVVQEHIKLEEQKWIRKAKRYLLYDDQPYRMK